jgi:hypothetical protein
MARALRIPTVVGDARFRSRLLSNAWTLEQGDAVLARLVRIPSRHTSEVTLSDGTPLELRPEGWGTVAAAFDDDQVWGRILRRSWWGRAWEIEGQGFAIGLTSDPLPRRWSLRIGSQAVGRLAGGVASYNRLDVATDVAVPVPALALAWHVLARPWEQAAAPGTLVVRPEPQYRVVPDA